MENKLKTVDAETLLSTPMSKTMFIVDNLIPQGVNVISGASKIGKSWLMLWLGLQVSQGLPVWGLATQQCDVLYLSLEDTQRRIKDRLYNLTDTAPSNLYFAVMCGLIGGGLEEQIIDFLSDHPKTKLVIIDTLQKVRDTKGGAGKTGMYGNDYDDISSIKKIADEYNIAILLVHHLRKLKDSEDPFNEVSGSTGIIGAADTNYVFKRKRITNAATLLVSGRDMEYQELTLQFNNLVWELVERKNSEDIHKAELPKFLFRVVDFMESRAEWVGTATELLAEMKETETTPNVVTKYLGQFSCEVLEPVGIEYRTKRTGKSRLIKLIRNDGGDENDSDFTIQQKVRHNRHCRHKTAEGGEIMRSKTLGINVRVTVAEKEKLSENAFYCGLSLSEYLRRLGLGKDVKAATSEKEYKAFRLVRQLKKDFDSLERSEILYRINTIENLLK